MTRSSYFVDFKEDKDNTFPEYIDILLHLYKYFVPVSYCVLYIHGHQQELRLAVM